MRNNSVVFGHCVDANGIKLGLVTYFLILFFCSVGFAQTSSFTFQGKLNDGGVAANGSYDMQFHLFDDATGTGQVGSTVTVNSVQAVSGIFTAEIDFGSLAFSGGDRFLEIGISPAGQGNFTTLTPRQKLGSSPYSIKSITAENAINLGGTAADQFVVTADPRMTDARIPLAGSTDYVQNGTTAQTGLNFNVGGTGTADVLNAVTQFNIGGGRVLSIAGLENLFVGSNAGLINDKGINNAFFGHGAGMTNSNGSHNTFAGANAGRATSGGSGNSFFGSNAGRNNRAGSSNSFYGVDAGFSNSFGRSNTFIGRRSGFLTTTGEFNTFIGDNAGPNNTTGISNIFIGANAGFTNIAGTNNVFIGSGGTQNSNIQVHTSVALGVGSLVARSNSISIGSTFQDSVSIIAPPVTQTNTIVLGTSSQKTLVDGRFRTGVPFGTSGADLPGRGYVETFFLSSIFQGIYTPNVIFGSFTANPRGSINACVLFQGIPGQTAGVILTNCNSPFSPASEKTDIRPFVGGIDVIKRLTPVAFNHKDGGAKAIGLNADDVEGIDPTLVQRDANLSMSNVSESGLSMVLVNSIKQQQDLIEAQQKQINTLERQIELLREQICSTNPAAAMCEVSEK